MQVSRMNGAQAPAAEQPAQRARLAPAGFVDELGERSLSFDPVTETLVETLRLRREFSEAPGFESALRDRVARLLRLKHPAFATIQSVVRTDTGLQIVSKYASGRRLSELTPIDNGFALAVDVIRKITPALAALQDAGAGTGHGALSLNRLVMTRDKRLIVVEHVLAPALETLHWSSLRFDDLNIVVPDIVHVRLDERTDMRQLGWIVLSLLLGRAIPAIDYPTHARELVDEARSLNTPLKTTPLGDWLEKALQIVPNSFANAREAAAAFGDLERDGSLQAAESAGALLAFHSETSDAASTPSPEPELRPTTPIAAAPVAAVPITPAPIAELKPVKPAPVPIDRSKNLRPVPQAPAELPPSAATAEPAAPTAPAAAPAPRARIGTFPAVWVAGALAVISLLEAVAIGVLFLRPSIVVQAPKNLEYGPPALPPVIVQGIAPAGANRAAPPATSSSPSPATSPSPAPVAAAAPGTRLGGFTVTSPIDLQVFKNGALVGSSAGPVAIGEGRHTLEFVNQALGFRTTQTVNVSGGQLTPVRIAIPNGRVSINAVPWAEVTIDGVAAGQTPLGNLALPIGSHEVVFRHPDLGERKQTVIVKVDVLTRVTETFK